MVEAPAVLALMRGFLRAGRKFPDYNLRQCVPPPPRPAPPPRQVGGRRRRTPPESSAAASRNGNLPGALPTLHHRGTFDPRSFAFGDAFGGPNPPAPGRASSSRALVRAVPVARAAGRGGLTRPGRQVRAPAGRGRVPTGGPGERGSGGGAVRGGAEGARGRRAAGAGVRAVPAAAAAGHRGAQGGVGARGTAVGGVYWPWFAAGGAGRDVGERQKGCSRFTQARRLPRPLCSSTGDRQARPVLAASAVELDLLSLPVPENLRELRCCCCCCRCTRRCTQASWPLRPGCLRTTGSRSRGPSAAPPRGN